MLTLREKMRLYSILEAFTIGELQKFVQLYIWLVYNDFTVEDLRKNIDFIKDMRSGKFLPPRSLPSGPDEMSYSELKFFWHLYKRLTRGKCTEDAMHAAYKEKRNVQLQLEEKRMVFGGRGG